MHTCVILVHYNKNPALLNLEARPVKAAALDCALVVLVYVVHHHCEVHTKETSMMVRRVGGEVSRRPLLCSHWPATETTRVASVGRGAARAVLARGHSTAVSAPGPVQCWPVRCWPWCSPPVAVCSTPRCWPRPVLALAPSGAGPGAGPSPGRAVGPGCRTWPRWPRCRTWPGCGAPVPPTPYGPHSPRVPPPGEG